MLMTIGPFHMSSLHSIPAALNSYLQSRPVHPLPHQSVVRSVDVVRTTKCSAYSSLPVLNTGQSVSFKTSLMVQFSTRASPDNVVYDALIPVYVKRTPHVEPSTTHGKRLRVVKSAMNELVFYVHVLPEIVSRQAIHAPALFSAFANTAAHRLHSAREAGEPQHDVHDALSSETSLILESFVGDSFHQRSPLEGESVFRVLRTLATLHSRTMGDADLLTLARQKLQRPAYWRLSRRPESELDEMPVQWKKFVSAFKGVDSRLDRLFAREGGMEFGERLRQVAGRLDDYLDIAAKNESYACIVHGDAKAMNMFIPVEDGGNVVLIDFQWTGVGLGAMDVAMFLAHSVHPSEIDSYAKIDVLLKTYHNTVIENIGSALETYPFERVKQHFMIASLDYARFVIGRFLKGATPEGMKRKRKDPNVGLMYRDVVACSVFLERIYDYLDEYLRESGSPRVKLSS